MVEMMTMTRMMAMMMITMETMVMLGSFKVLPSIGSNRLPPFDKIDDHDCDDNGDDVHGFPGSLPCGLGTPTRDDDSDDSPLGRTGCLQVTKKMIMIMMVMMMMTMMVMMITEVMVITLTHHWVELAASK